MPSSAKPVSPQTLEKAALRYLERFACPAEALRRVLMRRVETSARIHGTDREQGAGWVEALIARYRQSGVLNDGLYAEGRAASLHRRGVSTRAIRERLAAKGVDRDAVEGAMAALDSEVDGDADEAAARALARRRRLGPHRPPDARAAFRDKDMAALARAGFGYETARRVIDGEVEE